MADEMNCYTVNPRLDCVIRAHTALVFEADTIRQRVAELEGEVARLAVRIKEADNLILKTAVSHSKMAHAEYLRNPGYHNTHFSYLAEMAIIEYLEKYDMWEEFEELVIKDENDA